jgi:tRNA threonylcarbamoyladenosine biosynthesis protein TsaE
MNTLSRRGRDPMPTVSSNSPEETAAVGEAWGKVARAGWVIGLCGDLGAGKTQFVKGFARGLGYPGRVHSPTFALINEYTGGRFPLFHLDLYRLETREQIAGAGLEEYLYRPQGVAIVEWMDRWDTRSHPSPTLDCTLVRFEIVNEGCRQLHYEDIGP